MVRHYYQQTLLLVFLSLLWLTIRADRHLNLNGAFGKAHRFNEEPSPYACNRGSGLLSRLFPHRYKDIQSLNVSQTLYRSNDLLDITWPTISTSCKDDFIGIYSVDVPLIAGKQRVNVIQRNELRFFLPIFQLVIIMILNLSLLDKRKRRGPW